MTFALIIGIIIVLLALAFSFSTGFNDAANVVAVVISTRTLSPGRAVFYVGVIEFLGACFLGTAVARTIGKGIVDPAIITGDQYGMIIIFALLLGATIWNVFCTFLGFPVSASHALVGGFVGSGIAAAGLDVINWVNVLMIFGVLVTSPLLGFLMSLIITKSLIFLLQDADRSIEKIIIQLEIVMTLGAALVTGANAAQRPMGIIVFSLVILGLYTPVTGVFVPGWVVLSCGLSLMLGVIFAGKNVIRTVGMKYYKIRHLNGLCIQIATMGIVQMANVIGSPVSTTQVVSGAVIGTGAAERPKAVRWGMGYNVFLMWLITMPATALASGMIYFILLGAVKLAGF